MSRIETAINDLQPIITVLNYSQTDGASWPILHEKFTEMQLKVTESGREQLANIIRKRKKFIDNPIVKFYQLISNNVPIDEQILEKLTNWFNALGIP